ncbi:hypothetical protein [Streptosporangium subroseum]|nr:hypothetical protein OHB15_26650 [Streptosporangium subroseum]
MSVESADGSGRIEDGSLTRSLEGEFGVDPNRCDNAKSHRK